MTNSPELLFRWINDRPHYFMQLRSALSAGLRQASAPIEKLEWHESDPNKLMTFLRYRKFDTHPRSDWLVKVESVGPAVREYIQLRQILAPELCGAGTKDTGAAIRRAGIYFRVSNRQSEMQIETLRNLVQTRGMDVIREYVDKDSSDRADKFDEMLADAKAGQFDTVVVWNLRRFARSLRHTVLALADLYSSGVALISHQDNLDLSAPSDQLMFSILGVMAEFERELIRERSQAGKNRAYSEIAEKGYYRTKKGTLLTKWGKPRAQIDMSKYDPALSLARNAQLLGTNRETLRDRLKKINQSNAYSASR